MQKPPQARSPTARQVTPRRSPSSGQLATPRAQSRSRAGRAGRGHLAYAGSVAVAASGLVAGGPGWCAGSAVSGSGRLSRAWPRRSLYAPGRDGCRVWSLTKCTHVSVVGGLLPWSPWTAVSCPPQPGGGGLLSARQRRQAAGQAMPLPARWAQCLSGSIQQLQARLV